MTEIVFKEGGRNQRVFETMWRLNQGFWFKSESPKKTTNLCQWVRVVIIWPFLELSAFIVSAYLFFNVLSYNLPALNDPVVNANFWDVVQVALIVVGVIVAVIVVWAIVTVFIEMRRYRSYRSDDDEPDEDEETPWYKLIWVYLTAIKRRVCPVIRYLPTPSQEAV